MAHLFPTCLFPGETEGSSKRSPGALCSCGSPPQGYTPDRLPVSSCVTVPDLIPLNPAKILFVKVTKSLFGRKKNKSKFGGSVIVGYRVSGGWLLHWDVSLGSSEPLGEFVLLGHLALLICIIPVESRGLGSMMRNVSPTPSPDKNHPEERDEISCLVNGLTRASISQQDARPEVSAHVGRDSLTHPTPAAAGSRDKRG